jgi:hypothetical protein
MGRGLGKRFFVESLRLRGDCGWRNLRLCVVGLRNINILSSVSFLGEFLHEKRVAP